MDSSLITENVLTTRFNSDFELLLGDLQFSLVCFLFGEHFRSFEYWTDLTLLILNSFNFLQKNVEFLGSFIEILRIQLQELPEEIFEGSLDGDSNRLILSLTNFIEEYSDGEFSEGFMKIETILKNKFKTIPF